MREIQLGKKFSVTKIVTEDMLAVNVGSGDARVFSTPMLAALIENAAMNCVIDYLDDNESTVGTYIAINHISATPCGCEVTANAVVKSVNGKEITFEVSAFDKCGEIANGEHKRFAVNAQKFQNKADAKLID